MKKILFYTDTPGLGGAEKQMLFLAKHLKHADYSVSLAYGKYSKINQVEHQFEEFCEKIYVLPASHKHDPRHYFALKKILKEGDFDAIHLHLWNPGACRYAFFAAHQAGIPIITTEHDPFELTGLKRLLKINTLHKTYETIVLSNSNYELMTEYYGFPKDRVNLVHNGIEIKSFLAPIGHSNLRNESGHTVITCIAELHQRKGHRYLLEAFTKLQSSVPNLQLALVGDGPLRESLELKYKDNESIHFLGWRDDIPQLLHSSDIFILPSLKEAFGLVILEAMASSVPVIATRSGGVVDLIENGKTGILVPPASSEKIAEAIQTLLHNPDQKRDIVKAALERVKTHFTAKQMADSTMKVYEKILSNL